MDQLIPTLLGIAGVLVPVALAWWKQGRPEQHPREGLVPPAMPAAGPRRFAIDEAIVRGGRIYL